MLKLKSVLKQLGDRGLKTPPLPTLAALPWLRELDLLSGIHAVAHYAFRAMGFEWELRRSGDLKIGIWRKRLNRKHADRVAPKDAFLKRVVLVPGFGDTPLSWMPIVSFLMPVLKRRFDEFVVLDFPGFSGFLSRERSFENVDTLVECVADVLDSFRPDLVIGHSLGGYLSAHYAAKCGEGKRPLNNKQGYEGPTELILLDASGVFETDEDLRFFLGHFRAAAEQGFHMLRPYLFAREPRLFGLMQSQFGKFIQREDIVTLLQSVSAEHRIEALLGHVKARVWLIWGEHDTLVLTRWMSEWLKHLKPDTRARGIVIKDCGHSPHLEAPVATGALLGQILSGREPSESRSKAGRWWRTIEAAPAI